MLSSDGRHASREATGHLTGFFEFVLGPLVLLCRTLVRTRLGTAGRSSVTALQGIALYESAGDIESSEVLYHLADVRKM
jgi:hypothetical protein